MFQKPSVKQVQLNREQLVIIIKINKINIMERRLLGEKLRDGVRQQMLTNYYLHKYERFSGVKEEKKHLVYGTASQYASMGPTSQKYPQNQRKNFKQVMLGLKQKESQDQVIQRNQDKNHKKNFKQQIQLKKSQNQEMKQNVSSFLKLQSSIINQLYSPSPSKLQSCKYNSIQIRHQTENEHKAPLWVPSDDPIQITEFDEFQETDSQMEEKIRVDPKHEQQLSRISEAIKSKFERRKKNTERRSMGSIESSIRNSPSSHSSPPPRYFSVGSREKKQQKRQQRQQKALQEEKKFDPSRQEKQEIPELQETTKKEVGQYIFEEGSQNIRDIFQDMDKQIKNQSKKKPQSQYQRQYSVRSRVESQASEKKFKGRKLSRSRISLNKSFHQEKNLFLNRSRFHSDAGSEYKYKNSQISRRSRQSQDDSLNQIFPQIKHHAKESLYESEIPIQSFDVKQEVKDQRNQVEQKQSVNQLSMMSRFSMASEEGTVIRSNLERQVNENQYGPYQNALQSLIELIDEYPNAWPIFVVGQRILEDRSQYSEKRQQQTKQLSKLQDKILQQKRLKNSRQKSINRVGKNKLIILRLVRQLAQKL